MLSARTWKAIIFSSSVILVAAALSADNPPVFGPGDKAFYADEIQAAFARPGLVVKITKVEIATGGVLKVWVKMTDPKGAPLDRLGVQTPGPVTASFLVATIPNGGATQYVSYITRQRTVSGRTVTQATGESNGTWAQVGDGEYTYTYANKLPEVIDRNATHTVGMYATRNLSELEMGSYYANSSLDWVPAGSEVKVVRDVIRTASCNKCHDRLRLHGSRTAMETCIICHTPQTPDSRSDNTTDMKVMIHKIHMGANLPSVQAGGKYEVAGNDYSDIHFPSPMMACASCHEPKETAGATQADAWYTRPSRETCGSCHDNVNFATGANHAGLIQVSDNLCKNCHQPKGEMDFDLSIQGAHVVPEQSTLLRGVVVKIESVTEVAAGKSPTISYTLKDKKGDPWLPADLTNLRFYMAGPTVDIPSYIREDARAGSKGSNGSYSYTFTGKIPEGATGSFQFGVEGYKNTNVLEGTQQQRSIRDLISNQVVYAAIGGGTPEPRRAVVSTKKCNSCHYSISFHGGNRNQTEMCTFCHNPNLTEGTPAESWNFVNMIHRFHVADETHYPGRLTTCNQCHEGTTQALPMKAGLLPTKNALAPVNPTPPTTNACMVCHNTESAWSHAMANTSQLGESCAVCHAEGKSMAVTKVHAQ